MKVDITRQEANVIQVALDHLYDMHTDILEDSQERKDAELVRSSLHVLRMIGDIQTEISYKLGIYKPTIKTR